MFALQPLLAPMFLVAAPLAQEVGIHQHAQLGDVEAAVALIEADPGVVHLLDAYKQTPLHLAARYGRAAMTRLLLQHGADPDAVAYNHFRPLHLARDAEITRVLLESGADIHATSDKGSALDVAVRTEKLEVVEVLTEHDGELSLQHMLQLGWRDEVLEQLVGFDGQVSVLTELLPRAIASGDKELSDRLLELGADPQRGLWTALWRDEFDLARALIERGAQLHVGVGDYVLYVKSQWPVLIYYVAQGSPGIVGFLLELGADPNVRRWTAKPEWLRERHRKGEAVGPPDDDFTPLHVAASIGSVESTWLLLRAGADLELRAGGVTPLFLAACGGHPQVAHALIEAGAGVGVHEAAALGRVHDLAALLDEDPTRLDEPDPLTERTPLHYAALRGSPAAVRFLLARGVAIEPRAPAIDGEVVWSDATGPRVFDSPKDEEGNAGTTLGETPLHEAARAGQLEVAMLLVEAGADIEALTSDRETPLALACVWGHGEVARWLLAAGADPSGAGSVSDTPLHAAVFRAGVYKEDVELVETLIRQGADLEAMSSFGETPAQLAAQWGSREVLGLLIAAGAEVDLEVACVAGDRQRVATILDAAPERLHEPHHRNQRTPLTLAAWQGHADLVRDLLGRGAAVDEIDGLTGRVKNEPLHEAAAGGHIEVARVLLDHGMSVDAKVSWTRHTPIHGAARSAGPEMLAFLLERGASLGFLGHLGATPLHTAAWGSNAEVVRFLLMRGEDPNSVDRNGQTPLHDAASAGAVECAALLLDAGARVNQRDYSGQTALFLATRNARRGVASLLRLRGGLR